MYIKILISKMILQLKYADPNADEQKSILHFIEGKI